jgi:magnesium transporter
VKLLEDRDPRAASNTLAGSDNVRVTDASTLPPGAGETALPPPAEFTGFVWTADGPLAEQPTAREIGALLQDRTDASAWMLLPRRPSPVLDALARILELDALAVEDVLDENEGVKIDWLDETMIGITVLVHHPSGEPGVDVHRVSLIARRRALVVLADDEPRRHLLAALARKRPAVLADGVPAALHAVLDLLVDKASDALRAMEADADAISDQLFQDRPLLRQDQLRSFRLRRALASYRRSAGPMQDVARGLANAAATAATGAATDPAERLLGTRSAREFADVADHAAHNAAGADTLREVIDSMYETNLSLSDVHLNQVMKKLAGWAAIIAVPTFVTGFLGMNVPYPGYGTAAGAIVAVAVIVVAVAILYLLFRRKDWL